MFYVCGRKVKVYAKSKSQTVNVCTNVNQFGEYDYKIRIAPPCLDLENKLKVKAHTFGSLDEFANHVEHIYQGIIESRPTERSTMFSNDHHNVNAADSFQAWRNRWDELMDYSGSDLPTPVQRIESLRQLWNQPVPEGWKRRVDQQLLSDRYRRGDFNNPNPGEHQIEHEILIECFNELDFLGYKVIDGINAMPLTIDSKGGRRGNVEADLFLLLRKNEEHLLALCEVKDKDKNAWYALVENMRQLKLLYLSDAARNLFVLRNPSLRLPKDLPIMGCIVAPEDFYHHAGQKAKALSFAKRLIHQFRSWTGLSLNLTTWNRTQDRIEALAAVQTPEEQKSVQAISLLPGVPEDAIRACYDAAPGGEIESGKFASPESSAALVANAFGIFLKQPNVLPVLPRCQNYGWPVHTLALEEIVRFPWNGGRHPCLDVLITTGSALIGVESKRYEPFRAHPAVQFSDAHWRPVWGSQMSGYERMRDDLQNQSVIFNHLDSAQIIKHAFALRTEVQPGRNSQGKRPILYYLYAEPATWPDQRPVDAGMIHEHRNEIALFSHAVRNDEVIFIACSYRELLQSWVQSEIVLLKQHAKAVADHFSIDRPESVTSGSPISPISR
jgi:hypothetical protein